MSIWCGLWEFLSSDFYVIVSMSG